MKIYPLKYFLKNKNVMLSALEVLNISVSKSTNIKIHLSMAHFNENQYFQAITSTCNIFT